MVVWVCVRLCVCVCCCARVCVCVSVLRYVLTRRDSRAPQTPRILLVGPPGSGKSLQARRLADKYRLVDRQYRVIPMGSFIRQGRRTLENIAVNVEEFAWKVVKNEIH